MTVVWKDNTTKQTGCCVENENENDIENCITLSRLLFTCEKKEREINRQIEKDQKKIISCLIGWFSLKMGSKSGWESETPNVNY